MEIIIPTAQGVHLKITDRREKLGAYATSSLPKGLLLVLDGLELAEEAVGFGFPVIKRRLQTIFPGELLLTSQQTGSAREITAQFRMNRVEKISRPGTKTVENRSLYAMKNLLAAVIRSLPSVRGLLTSASSLLRKLFSWETTYTDAGFSTWVTVITTIDEDTGKISVEVDASAIPAEITEVAVMNEQGAHFFDHYGDSSGMRLEGEAIGCWDEVTAEEAWFESRARSVAFRLRLVEGARLFRGRELVGNRLAWAGFGYTFQPSIRKLRYELKIERLA